MRYLSTAELLRRKAERRSFILRYKQVLDLCAGYAAYKNIIYLVDWKRYMWVLTSFIRVIRDNLYYSWYTTDYGIWVSIYTNYLKLCDSMK